MKKRIAILGTSNSIMTLGWASSFIAHAADYEVVNFSLGGNTALFMPGQQILQKITTEFDLCIIELYVNDQRYIDTGFFRDSYFAATLAGLLAAFRTDPAGGRCVPLVLSLPKKDSYRIGHYYDSCGLTLARLCHALGVPMLDLGEVIRAACLNSERQPGDFLSDPLHLKPVVQRHVAAALLRNLAADWPGLLPAAEAAAELIRLAPVFAAVPAAGFQSQAGRARRETSLAGWDVLRLQPGEEALIPLPTPFQERGGWFCGLLHWADGAAGHLVIRSGKAPPVQKLLRKIWSHPIFFFTHSDRPLPLAPGEGVQLRAGAEPGLESEPAINPSLQEGVQPSANDLAFGLFCDRDPDQAGEAILARISGLTHFLPRAIDTRLAQQLRVIPLEG